MMPLVFVAMLGAVAQETSDDESTPPSESDPSESAPTEPPPPPPPPPAAIIAPTPGRTTQPSPAARPVYGSPDRWQLTDRRARGVVTAGWITGLSGFGLEALGSAIDNEGVVVFGGMAELTGSPMIAGGSLRSARALREQGATVHRTWGSTAWFLWSSGIVLGLAAAGTYEEAPPTDDVLFAHSSPEAARAAEALALASVGCRVLAYVTGGLQSGANNRARRSLGYASTDDDPPPFQLIVTPTFGDQTLGVAVGSPAF